MTRAKPTASWVLTLAFSAGCSADESSPTDSAGSTGLTTVGSSSSAQPTSSTAGPSTTGPTSTSGPAGTDTGSSEDHGINFDLGSADLGSANVGCSQDLKRVIDLDSGAIVEQCPPEEGCFEGQCVPACEAAAGADGSMGCEFLIPTSPFYANGNPGASQSGPCHALMVSNPWDRSALLDLSREGVDFDVQLIGRIPNGIAASTTYEPIPETGIPPGGVALVFLSHRPGVANGTSLECPIAPALLQDTAAHGTTTGLTFELTSDTPIQAYDIIPYGGAASYLPSASLLYPRTSWGTDYVAITPHSPSNGNWLLAVASQDNTTIEFNPVVPINAGSIANPPVGQATSYTLNAGEVVQWSSAGDLGGSLLAADRPVGVFAGNPYLLVSTADFPVSGQDSAHQQVPDVNALASEYVGPGLVSRLDGSGPESVLYRFVGVTDGTTLTWDPMPDTAPATLDAGQIVEFETRTLFTVRSQDEDHPFSLSQYMSGTLGPGGLGDEEWVVPVAPLQYVRSYAFFVDPTYITSTLVVTRIAGEDGFAPVELECMGELGDWQPVGDEGLYEVAHVDLFRDGVNAAFPACETSQHRTSSEGAFGVNVWGTASAASYGYPAGGSLATINEVEIDPAG